eukprot:5431784-Pyramimonas_sp.AAC.1
MRCPLRPPRRRARARVTRPAKDCTWSGRVLLGPRLRPHGGGHALPSAGRPQVPGCDCPRGRCQGTRP